jgi:Response regulator containing a CheY-like receiver domain and an HTH DNA-binding domain
MNRILVIEDQPQMRKNLVTILVMENFDVASAENGRVGIDLARSQTPDLIICDVMMPDVDGYGVLKALRETPATADIPFIFLTAKGDKNDVRVGMNLGADDYLTKPVVREDLLAAISARLERKRISDSQASGSFQPDFSSPEPLKSLGLTDREAEVLLWVSQGKSNGDIGIILGMAEKTVKKHMGNIFEKLGIEGRNAATVRALEVLSSSPRARK